jgi:hypothetical protein
MKVLHLTSTVPYFRIILLLGILGSSLAAQTPQQLEKWLKRFPQADTNGDGRLTVEEANAYLNQRNAGKSSDKNDGQQTGAPATFKVDPGWDEDRFPDYAVSYQSPEQIEAIYAKVLNGKGKAVTSFEKPTDGSFRIVGTGHSFMAPGYKTLPLICEAAGMEQALFTHTGGGITGSARYKWEQENGIFDFDGKPLPKLLASIANADWEAMIWGPYFNDRPEYYSCWIDFSRKYHPDMNFFLSDAWPQLGQLSETPVSESELTEEVFDRMGDEKRTIYSTLINKLREDYGTHVFILPTSDALVLAAKRYLRGELPGVEGINTIIGKKEKSLWRDHLGHLGPGFERLEGYVFYATLYKRSPELIRGEIKFEDNDGYPSPELDKVFRIIAWEAVIGNPLSGVRDENLDGIGD